MNGLAKEESKWWRWVLLVLVVVGVLGADDGCVSLGLPRLIGTGALEEPVGFAPGQMLHTIYTVEENGNDFWIDRMLARYGKDPAGDYLLTKGRTVYMRSHNPAVVGFGGDLAYIDGLGKGAYSITFAPSFFTEDVNDRASFPSHWRSTYNSRTGVTVTVKKFITEQNVAVTVLGFTNNTEETQRLQMTVRSPLVSTTTEGELRGEFAAPRNLTMVQTRLFGEGLVPVGQRLVGQIVLEPHQTVETKVLMGFITEEIPESKEEYEEYKAYDAHTAFSTHVNSYNRWWVDNVPYIDVPDPYIKKMAYYRWWIVRYNTCDADLPGYSYMFPTFMEGVLGYNNAITNALPWQLDEGRYLRSPIYTYGTWLTLGQTSGGGAFRDNPGSPHWGRRTGSQYVSKAGWETYKVHGGGSEILQVFAEYGEQDFYDTLRLYDRNGNYLTENQYDAWDADTTSLFYSNVQERLDSAYPYANGLAVSRMYRYLGNETKADELAEVAGKMQKALIDFLWDPESKLFLHRDISSNAFVPWKEINNYYPFTMEMVPKDDSVYREALRLWGDRSGFVIWPAYVSNVKDYHAAKAAGCGISRNFAPAPTGVTLSFLARVIKEYPSEYISVDMFKELLYWYTFALYVDGNGDYPDANEFFSDWDNGQIGYRSWIHHNFHSKYNVFLIEDIAGLTPRTDTKLELYPIDIGWDHFAIDNLRYHGVDLTIVWDRPDDGKQYYQDVPEGYSVYVNGTRSFTVDSLVHLIWDSEEGRISFLDQHAEISYNRPYPLKSALEVSCTNDRLASFFGLIGVDLSKEKMTNLALRTDGAYPKHTASCNQNRVFGAVDGSTTSEPKWTTQGSSRRQDWYQIDFGVNTVFDTVKLYFFNDQANIIPPLSYKIQYFDGEKDTWLDVFCEHKQPETPRGLLNTVTFAPVVSKRLRVLLINPEGVSVGLTEIQVFNQSGSSPTLPSVLVEEIAIEQTKASDIVFIGMPVQMQVTVSPANASNEQVRWSVIVLDGEAEIGPTGLLTGRSVGQVKVMATAMDGSGITAERIVTVSDALTVLVREASGTLDLGQLQAKDWIHLGGENQGHPALPGFSHMPTNRALGKDLITFTELGKGRIGLQDDNSVSVSWTGGTPRREYRNSLSGGVFHDRGHGWQAVIPATDSIQEVWVYAGGWRAKADLRVSLSDAKESDYLLVCDNPEGHFNKLYVIRFRATEGDQVLTITNTVDTMYDHWGNICINAIVLLD
ncbi:MAG: Ig-like domain-containing protein [Limnochordia bacterium]|nr:Ig-like domain-containing protein [Limnochordia bacterium]